jgi:phosphatidylserine/phosphatidylglycerophosphate/cardiolipin synthase-like enzyme
MLTDVRDRAPDQEEALTRAADRGVKVRIYLDGTQFAGREPVKVFRDLAEMPGVEIRTKHKPAPPMHPKSYQIDGRLLGTGVANFFGLGIETAGQPFDRDRERRSRLGI